MSRKRVLVVGGVAGGASCAARLRRMNESADIIIYDRGPHVSFANCGLPYYVGNVIKDESQLLLATPELFKNRFNIEVKVKTDVTAIDRDKKEITVKDLTSGKEYQEKYDALVLSPGASPIKPPLPGIDLPGIFTLRNIPDSEAIKNWMKSRKTESVVIVGAGFIGLEMLENLFRLGLKVTVVEMQPQVMPIMDPEMAVYVEQYLTGAGIDLKLSEQVKGFEEIQGPRLRVDLQSGNSITTDMVIMGIGVKPESDLAKAAGLTLGARGGIVVNEFMQTSDPDIWAIGDAVEVKDYVTGQPTQIPMAGPANRQGRIAADNIAITCCGKPGQLRAFRGTQGTAVCGIFEMTVATTGASERTLKRLDIPYRKVYIHPGHHTAYYPGAKPIHLKLLYAPETGLILGAQAVGSEGVDKRIDVIAALIQKQGTVYDMEDAELCYAPQYGSAKDPVNIAGMVAANDLRGDSPLVWWENVAGTEAVIVDVREPMEFAAAHLPQAMNIPLGQLRNRLDEIPKDKEIWCHCGVGQRSNVAVRILRENGYNAKNLTGGLQTCAACRF